MVFQFLSRPPPYKLVFFRPFRTHALVINCTTAYGRVANLKSEPKDSSTTKREDKTQSNLVEHFTALLLAVFVEAGLLQVLILNNFLKQTLNYKSVIDDSGGR